VVDGHIVTGFLESNLTSSVGEGTMSGQRVAYTRVSTLDQNTARQLDGTAVDCTFTDKSSGKDVNRPQLAAMLGFVRERDTVIVHCMDRLACNLDDLRRIVGDLTARGVRVQFVKEQLPFTGEDTVMASLLLSVMGAFAEFERAFIGERQREGITLAKQRGAYRGRKKSPTEDKVTQVHQRAGAGEAKSSLAREFGISRETVYEYLRAGS
jgi:DNA invertase Pin-like site-specific DNA recombinase